MQLLHSSRFRTGDVQGPALSNASTTTSQANKLQSSVTMFNLADHAEKLKVDDPPVVYSSFRSVQLTSPPCKIPPPTAIQTLAPPGNDIEAVCAELPKKLQLGKPIWHSQEESPEDFRDRDFQVAEPCYKYMDEKGVMPGSPWPPLSLVFPACSASAAEDFSTPQLVETQPGPSDPRLITEHLFNAWLGTNVVIEAEWTIEPSKVCL